MENKKIRGATRNVSQGIKFKSQLEKSVYNTLSQLGFFPQYEPKTFTLWDGFTPITPYYDRETDTQRDKRNPKSPKMLTLKSSKIVGIRYTPDFYFKYKDIDIWVEAKGIENDVFYIKKKLFIKYLDNLYEETGQRSMYFEVYTKKHLLQAINIIRDYEMRTVVDKMLSLVPSLPTLKDRDLADKFIAERKFDKLYELVKSDVLKTKKMDEEYIITHCINVDGMNEFLAEIISYLDIIGWDEEDINDEEEEY
jgi:hypothetical protein